MDRGGNPLWASVGSIVDAGRCVCAVLQVTKPFINLGTLFDFQAIQTINKLKQPTPTTNSIKYKTFICFYNTRMTSRQQLADLPDDILFLVFACLESARDLWALALSCRRLQHLISNDGWRIFVRNRFPSLSPPAPATGSHTWPQLADSMTWQSRCWDKRSLQFEALLPHIEPRRNGRYQGLSGRGLFMAVVDAHFDPSSQQEIVAWGAGEDLVARRRERRGRARASKTSWHRVIGRDYGLTVGYDDVTSIKVIEYGGRPAIITGRHTGHVSLLSAEPDSFGERIAQFGPVPVPNPNPRRAPEQDIVGSLDILNDGSKRLLAAASRLALRVYDLAGEETAEFVPVATYDMKPRVFTVCSARLGGARWMDQGETMALGLIGCKDPLRYLSLTPTGWSQHVAAKSERVEEEFNVKFDRTIVPNSMEIIHPHSGAKRGRSLLLSSWKDGTIRYVNPVSHSSPKRRRKTHILPQTPRPTHPLPL